MDASPALDGRSLLCPAAGARWEAAIALERRWLATRAPARSPAWGAGARSPLTAHASHRTLEPDERVRGAPRSRGEAMTARTVPTVEWLELIQLATEDVPGTAAFYADVLGATVIDAPSPHWARVRLANIEIGIHARPPAGSAPHGWEPGFRVADIAAFRAHLQAHGVTIAKDFHDIPGGVTLAFLDPAGNAIGVYQYGTSEAALRR